MISILLISGGFLVGLLVSFFLGMHYEYKTTEKHDLDQLKKMEQKKQSWEM